MRRCFGILLACAAFYVASARAQDEGRGRDDVDTKQIFGFTEGTDINAPGEHEAEFVTTVHLLKRGGLFRALEQEATDEGALTDRFGYELTLHGAAVQARGVPGLESLGRVGFSGLSAEPKFVLVSRDSAPVGVALSFQPEWRRIDEASGQNTQSFSLPVRLMADAALNEKLFLGVNLLYAPERDQAQGAPATLNALWGATGAMSWRVTPQIFVGGEVEAYAATESLGLGGAATAVYLGPTFFVRLSPKFFVAGGWSAQIGGRPAAGALGEYNQTEFSRHKAELTLGVAF